MLFRFLFLSWFLFSGTALLAQDVYTSSGKPVNRTRANAERSGFDPDRLVYGGGISLGFGGNSYYGGNSFLIGASPTVGYRFTDAFMAGIGVGYTYQSISKGLYNPLTGQSSPARYHWVYPNLWARVGIFENIFLGGEYAYNVLSYNFLDNDPSGSGNVITRRATENVSSLLLGGGLRQRISDRSSILIGAYYNVLGKSTDRFNPYPGNLVLRTGISIGY